MLIVSGLFLLLTPQNIYFFIHFLLLSQHLQSRLHCATCLSTATCNVLLSCTLHSKKRLPCAVVCMMTFFFISFTTAPRSHVVSAPLFPHFMLVLFSIPVLWEHICILNVRLGGELINKTPCMYMINKNYYTEVYSLLESLNVFFLITYLEKTLTWLKWFSISLCLCHEN